MNFQTISDDFIQENAFRVKVYEAPATLVPRVMEQDMQIMITKQHMQIMIDSQAFNSSPPGQNGRYIGRRHFQLHFIEWKW